MPQSSSHVCDLCIINQYCTPIMFYCENVCSKQLRNYFLVFSLLIIIVRLMLYYKKCVQNKRALLFSLLPYFFNTKKCVLKASRNLRFRLLSYFSNTSLCPKRAGMLFNLFDYFSNTKTVCSKQAGGCFLIYLATFLKRKNDCSKQVRAAF